MNIFVTGATGFIGRRLVQRLLAEGCRVRCLARHPERAAAWLGGQVEIIPGSVHDGAALAAAMRGCGGLFHLANLYSMWERRPGDFYRVNVEGTQTVLASARQAGVGRVVYISTAVVYGRPAACPFTEDDPPGPRLFSAYARTKAAAERLAWDFHHRFGLPLVVLYPGIVLGAGDDKPSGHYIQDLVRRRLPSTIFHHSPATYVYVGDVVEALIQAMTRPQAVGQKYLLGAEVLTGREFTQLVSAVSAVPLPPLRLPDPLVLAAAGLFSAAAALTGRPPLWGLSLDAARTLWHGFCFDGSKAQRELGIVYTPIRAALAEAIASYLKKGNTDQPG